MSFSSTSATIGLTLTLVINAVSAADQPDSWLSFRNGGSSAVAGNLPVNFSPTNGIQWQHETEGYGQSAPLIVNGNVVISSVIGDMKQTCALTAYDLTSGEMVWQCKTTASQLGPSNYMNARAAPTPVADDSGVYCFYESGMLLAADHKGTKLWERDLAKEMGEFKSNHGLGSSLAQSDKLLFMNLEHKGPSCLLAINKSDGKARWKTDRPQGSSWTTPVVMHEHSQVIVSSAGHLAGYSIDTGEEAWKVEGLEGNTVPSPSIMKDRVFVGARIPEFGAARDAAPSNRCVQVGPDSVETLWKAKNAVCDYASPVVAGDHAYFLNKVGVLTCVNADTGQEMYRERLRTECWATPIVAENGIHFFGKDGSVKTIATGSEFKVVSTSRLWPADQAPAPESYTETTGDQSHGHGASGHGASGHGATAEAGSGAHKAAEGKSTSGGRRGGMIAAMMRGDSNLDGILAADEISPDFRPMLARVDTNGDGSLDKEELEAMARSFAERRKNSRQSARDPIVYGVAAVPGTMVIRTGTRLYCISGTAGSDAEVSQ
ncbi:MAG: PQQ-binding-like beta-propeller repeat protein [Fuerstiella sp.]